MCCFHLIHGCSADVVAAGDATLRRLMVDQTGGAGDELDAVEG